MDDEYSRYFQKLQNFLSCVIAAASVFSLIHALCELIFAQLFVMTSLQSFLMHEIHAMNHIGRLRLFSI